MLWSAWVPLTSPLTYRLSLSYQDDRPGCLQFKHIIWWVARGHARLASPLNQTLISSVLVCFTILFLSRRSRQRERHHAVTWRNQCHDHAALQRVRIPSTILKIVLVIFYFLFHFSFPAVCLTSVCLTSVCLSHVCLFVCLSRVCNPRVL